MSVSLAGCASRLDLPRGEAAIAVPDDQLTTWAPTPEYRFGLGDEIGVTVFREPELSLDRAMIDPSGRIGLPSIGQIPASGRTADELSREIADRLNVRLLRNAQVSVSLLRASSRVVTVDGAVNKPGIYPIGGRISLVQAVASAEGVTEQAALSEVVIFRRVEGQRMAAVFSLADIRAGRAPDPEIRSGDVVVVGLSRARQLYRDLLQVLPGLAGVFVAIEQN